MKFGMPQEVHFDGQAAWMTQSSRSNRTPMKWVRTIALLLIVVCDQRCSRTDSLPICTHTRPTTAYTRGCLHPPSTANNTILTCRASARLAQWATRYTSATLGERAIGTDGACGGDGLRREARCAVVGVKSESLDAGSTGAR